MKHPDEIALYNAMRERARVNRDLPNSPGLYALQEESARLGIPYKRAHAWVEKWARVGWWDYGVSVRGGWFTREAPNYLPRRAAGENGEGGTT